MKINPSKQISEIAQRVDKVVSKTQPSTPEVKQLDQCAQNCSEAYGKALVSMQAKNDTSVIEHLFEGSEIHITRTIKQKDGTIRIQAGRPIKGFNDLYDSSVRICQKYDLDGQLKIFIKDEKLQTIDIYTENGDLITHFTKDDMEALHYYKYHPQDLHKYLRYGKSQYSGSFFEEMERAVAGLEKIFNTESQIQRTQKTMTVYRGMHIGIDDIGNVGDTFTDKSFTSTTTSLDVARRFAGKNPVLELEIPENTKFINIDNIFNIDHIHWREDELLLENNNSVEIIEIDEVNNIVKARLIK